MVDVLEEDQLWPLLELTRSENSTNQLVKLRVSYSLW